MTVGSGIAVAGIWLSIAVAGFSIGAPAVILGFFAMLTTIIIAS